jgi:hypothetical protein
MRRKRIAVDQIAAVVKQAELGLLVAGLIRQAGILGAGLRPLEKGIRGLAPRPSR